MRSSLQPKRTPPPNYGSRRVQVRLLVVVGSLMLVLVLMAEARKAENWEWMWRGVRDTESLPMSDEEIDTRLQPKPRTETPPGLVLVEPADEDRAAESSSSSSAATADQSPPASPTAAPDDNGGAAASDEPSPAPWSDEPNVDTADRAEAANETVAAADESTGRVVSAVDWQDLLSPAQRKTIRDDTVWRPDERDAWFRLLDVLRQTSETELKSHSEGRVGFVQLFRQPDVYRGRPVTVEGTVRLAYHVQAPRNALGIEGYYVFWLRPAGGPNSPIVVYALELPPGFPALPDKDIDEATSTLEEDVTFTGIFFKRWAYRSRGGLHTAPIMLAKVAEWEPARTARRATPPPSLPVAAGSLAAIAGIAALVAVLVYRRTRAKVLGAESASAEPARGSLDKLHQATLLPRPEEHLRGLSQRAKETQ